MPTSKPVWFASSTTRSTGAAPESPTIRNERSAEWRSGAPASRSIPFPGLPMVWFGSSGAYRRILGCAGPAAHFRLLRRPGPRRRGRDDALRHEAEGGAFGRILLELPPLAALRRTRKAGGARSPRREAGIRRSAAARLHAHAGGARGPRQLAARADERAAADSRHRAAQALLRRGDEPGGGLGARAHPGGSAPGAARRLRGEGARDRPSAPRGDSPRRASPRATARRLLAPGGRYSTVTVLARFRGWSTLRPRSRAMR